MASRETSARGPQLRDAKMDGMADSVRSMLRAIPSLTGTAPQLNTNTLPDDPATLFLKWFAEALSVGVPEPHAMTLSTVDSEGTPDARTLILKDLNESGWAFASTASSRKASQLAAQPAAALSFWWQPAARAVRVQGGVREASREESIADLRSRSPQAQSDVAEDDWTLFYVQPARVEFWQGSPNRRHTRIIYTANNSRWTRYVL